MASEGTWPRYTSCHTSGSVVLDESSWRRVRIHESEHDARDVTREVMGSRIGRAGLRVISHQVVEAEGQGHGRRRVERCGEQWVR